MKKLVAILMVGILCLSLVACSKKGNAENVEPIKEKTTVEIIKEKGKIVVGTSADYPPYEYHTMIDGKDEIVGFDIELAKLIGSELGVEVEIQDMPFDGLLISLAEGKYDMVIAGLSVDPKRQVLFSDSYHTRGQSLIVKKENAGMYKTISDLDGKKIGGQKGTVQEELAVSIADTNPISLIKFTDLITEVKNGTIDALLADSDVAVGYVAANEDLVISDVTIDYENSNVAIAFEKENQALCDAVNEVLAKLNADGTIEKIIEKTMSEGIENS